MWYLYITINQNGALYTGITSNLERRFKEHLQGKGGHYTLNNRPQKLLYTEKFSNRAQAEARERQIKRWSRKKKKALIEGDFEQLRKLSVSKDHLPYHIFTYRYLSLGYHLQPRTFILPSCFRIFLESIDSDK